MNLLENYILYILSPKFWALTGCCCVFDAVPLILCVFCQVFISVESIASALLSSENSSDTQDMLTALEQISTAARSSQAFPHPAVSYKTEKHRLDPFMSVITASDQR